MDSTRRTILLNRTAGTTNEWRYLTDGYDTVLTRSEPNVMAQIIGIINEFQLLFGSADVTIICPMLANRGLAKVVTKTFPGYFFFSLHSVSLRKAFSLHFEKPRRKKAGKTLYIGSDASGSTNSEQSAWAWYAETTHGAAYGAGVSVPQHTFMTELEGLLNAVIANRGVPQTHLHISCDSLDAISLFRRFIVDGESVNGGNAALESLVNRAREVAGRKKVTVRWVKGHKMHRLNIAADSIASSTRRGSALGALTDNLEAGVAAISYVYSRTLVD